MPGGTRVWACDFGLEPDSGFKMRPVYNSCVEKAELSEITESCEAFRYLLEPLLPRPFPEKSGYGN